MQKKHRYVAWGCGEYAAFMMEHLNLLKENLKDGFGHLVPDIEFFLDRNPQKQNTFFCGKSIFSPNEYENRKCDTVVISVKNVSTFENEYKWLLEIGQERIFTINDFFQEVYNNLVSYRTEIQNSHSLVDKGILARLLIGEKLEKKDSGHLSEDIVNEIIEHVGVSAFIAGLWYSFREKNEILVNDCLKWEYPHKSRIKTIGLISSRLGIGGAEHVVAILSAILAGKGYKVVLINEIIEETDYKYPEIVDRVVISKNFLSRTYEHFKELEHIVKERHIDLVCFHIPYDGIEYFYKLLFFKCLGVHVMTECHTSVANLMRRWGGLSNQNAVYSLNEALVTMSTKDAEFWGNYDINSMHIPNPTTYELKLPFVKRNNEYRLLWVGRISQKEKRVQDAVRIFSVLYNRNKNYSLNIIGTSLDDFEMDELARMIEEYDLTDSVHILGWKSDLSEYYMNSDVFLMTSPGEGFPMVLLEAKAYSLPIVMYELPYLELVKDNLGIISVPQGDELMAAEAIDNLLTDKLLYEKKNRQSWESVQTYINCDIGKDWEELIGSLSYKNQ